MATETQPSRRQVLMLKAQELFARKGIDAVSLNEINKAAGQRNTSALHYHFGNKQGLVDAIIYDHYAAIDLRLNQLMDDYERLPKSRRGSRQLVAALVTPFCEQLESEQGINYLLIVSQVFMRDTDMILKGHPEGEDTARLRIFQLFAQLSGNVPAQIKLNRTVLSAGMMFNSLASYAQLMLIAGSNPLGNRTLFVSSLTDNLHAMLTAKPSKATLALL